jgi:hypothetical protein
MSGLGHWEPLTVGEVADVMAQVAARWWFTGGHALELHTGRSWRTHDDIDVGICRCDVNHLARLLGEWEIFLAARGTLMSWDGNDVGAERNENNLWLRRRGDEHWRLDIAIGDGDEHEWRYRRDSTFRLPWSRVVMYTAEGLPYLAPALALLFKSKDVRSKDQRDAEEVIPRLDPASVATLDLRLPSDHPWRRLVAGHRRGMTARDVLAVRDHIERAGVAVWIDGGWGVDALLGEQTRPHADLDVAVPTRHFDRARTALEAEGYSLARDDGPFNVVLGDPAGRLVDIHAFDDSTSITGPDGIVRHGPNGLAYEVGGFAGEGSIDGVPVRCIGAEAQMRYHTGYAVDDDDWHDAARLHQRFGLAIPDDYRRFGPPPA